MVSGRANDVIMRTALALLAEAAADDSDDDEEERLFGSLRPSASLVADTARCLFALRNISVSVQKGRESLSEF